MQLILFVSNIQNIFWGLRIGWEFGVCLPRCAVGGTGRGRRRWRSTAAPRCRSCPARTCSSTWWMRHPDHKTLTHTHTHTHTRPTLTQPPPPPFFFSPYFKPRFMRVYKKRMFWSACLRLCVQRYMSRRQVGLCMNQLYQIGPALRQDTPSTAH